MRVIDAVDPNIMRSRVYVTVEARTFVCLQSTVGFLENEYGQVISDSEEKAEKLNDFFCSVFTEESKSDMPVPDTCFVGNNNEKLQDIVITPEMIWGKLQHLKLDTAAGNDNLSPRLLKSISSEIALPIAMTFRKSVDRPTGRDPQDWRTANITPLFKIGKRSQAENYRPVCGTSQICKIVESVLRDELVSHYDKHNLIKESQHEFRKGYSCASNLLGVTFTTDLKTAAHCKDIYPKANRMLGLLSRTIKCKNLAVLTNLYKPLVRPHLEYCSTTWNPQSIRIITRTSVY